MTDEARIARLTELAREAWPHDYDVRIYTDGQGHASVTCTAANCRTRLLALEHPRALDALEAALLVLAGRETGDVVLDLAGLRANRVLEQADAQRSRLEQLADEWEARAKERTRETAQKFGPAAAAMGPVLELLVQGMANELREALKP